MRIDNVGPDGCMRPPPRSMKFATRENELRVSQSDAAAVYRLACARRRQMRESLSSASPKARRLYEQLEQLAFALMRHDDSLSLADSRRRVIRVYPRRWAAYRRASQE